MRVDRRHFLAGLLGVGTGTVVAGAAGAVAVAPVAPNTGIPASGALVVEFDALRFPHRDDGDYHSGIIGALRHVRHGRKIFEVGGQCIFPVYGCNGNPMSLANIILIPEHYQADGGYFGDAPKVHWLGGDKFERVA